MSHPLLITSAIAPPAAMPYLRMTDPVRRKLLTKAAALIWAGKGISRLVIADATDATVLSREDVGDLEICGVEVEQLAYVQDLESTISRGKGYAEGRLMDFALRHSRVLGDSSHFYKSTGKTFCRNFSAIDHLVDQHAPDALFWRYSRRGDTERNWCDCRFYFTSREFASSTLIPAYLAADDHVAVCEQVIYQAVSEKLTKWRAPRPLIHGFAGGHDKEYFDQPLGYLDAAFPCWILGRGSPQTRPA